MLDAAQKWYRRTVFGCFVMLSPLAGLHAEEVFVQVKTTALRDEPKFYAAKVTAVNYGQALQKVEEKDGWVKVTLKGKAGYLPVSSITPQKIILADRAITKVAADTSDIVLAGKGFGPDVESRFKKTANAGRYDLVDKVERQCRVEDRDLMTFVKVGGLKG